MASWVSVGLIGLLSVNLLSCCCPSFMDRIEWKSLQDYYKTDSFTTNFDCKTVPMSVFYQNDCLEMFALRWYCLKQCLKHCGNNLADISTVICPLRHQFICRNPTAMPDDIDFQCACVKRSKPGLCLTKLYTLDDLSDDFNTTCLNSAKLLVVTPAAPAAAATPTVAVIATQARSSPQPPLIPVTVVKQPDGPVVALNQDETTTVVSSTTVFETTPLQTTEEFETEESSLKITQDTSKKPTAPSLLGQKTTTKSRALTTEDTDDITSNKPVQTSKSSLGKTLTSKSATTNRVSTSDTDRLSTSTVDKLSTSAAEKLSTSGANRLSSARGTTETEGLSRGAQTTKNLLKTTGDSSDSTGSSSTGTVNAAINNKKVSVDDTTDSSKTSKRLATALTSSLGTTAK